MKVIERNACLESFGQLCEEASKSDLVSDEECQYWVFERGYLAAIDTIMRLAESGPDANVAILPELQLIANKLASK